eukprot:6144512-Amphidinium_carterae.1
MAVKVEEESEDDSEYQSELSPQIAVDSAFLPEMRREETAQSHMSLRSVQIEGTWLLVRLLTLRCNRECGRQKCTDTY